jgi:YD repeat-containing protein
LLSTDTSPTETSVSTLTTGTNRLESVTTGAQLRQLGHDGRGNITTDTRSGIPLSLGYDAYGRLTSYVAPSATMTMRYSGTDERIEAVAGAVARRFAYDESQRTIGE